jgi:hypothetical protein
VDIQTTILLVEHPLRKFCPSPRAALSFFTTTASVLRARSRVKTL